MWNSLRPPPFQRLKRWFIWTIKLSWHTQGRKHSCWILEFYTAYKRASELNVKYPHVPTREDGGRGGTESMKVDGDGERCRPQMISRRLTASSQAQPLDWNSQSLLKIKKKKVTENLTQTCLSKVKNKLTQNWLKTQLFKRTQMMSPIITWFHLSSRLT